MTPLILVIAVLWSALLVHSVVVLSADYYTKWNAGPWLRAWFVFRSVECYAIHGVVSCLTMLGLASYYLYYAKGC